MSKFGILKDDVKPNILSVEFNGIPLSLKNSEQWVLWCLESKNTGGWTKPPYQADGSRAKTNSPETWASFDDARTAYESGRFDGIGVIVRDGVCGIDLDHVLDSEGELEPWAKEILEKFSGTYIERSPSGDGLHILARGVSRQCGKAGPENRLECYDESSPRYFTVTGSVFNGAADVTDQQDAIDWLYERYFAKPAAVERSATLSALAPAGYGEYSDEEVVDRAMHAGSGEKFVRLFEGDICGYPSRSDADLALCNILAFWTQDSDQIDRLFRSSGLYRSKWDEPHSSTGRSYGEMTVAKALSGRNAAKGAENAGAKLESPKAPENRSRQGLSFVQVSELLAKSAEIQWLIEGRLEQNTLCQLFGPSGSGKSFVAIDWACSIATGRNWNGLGVAQGPVFYIAGEGQEGLGRRLKAWSKMNGTGLASAPLYFLPVPVSLMDERTAMEIADEMNVAFASHGAPRLLVIDTLARNVGDGDENSNTDMGRFINVIDTQLRNRFGCAVLIVHHSGKSDKGQARGASCLRAAMHHEYRVDDVGGCRKLVCSKMKESELPPDAVFRIEPVILSNGEAIESKRVTSAVAVWIDEAVRQISSRGLAGQAETARKALILALERHGKELEHATAEVMGVEPYIRVVEIAQWKEVAVELKLSKGDKDAQRKAFERAKKGLVDGGHASVSGDFCWIP